MMQAGAAMTRVATAAAATEARLATEVAATRGSG